MRTPTDTLKTWSASDNTIHTLITHAHRDRVRLREAVQNLLKNALKFGDPKRIVRIEIGARTEGNEIVCYVRDNGIGIASDYHERVFDIFEQLDVKRDGRVRALLW